MSLLDKVRNRAARVAQHRWRTRAYRGTASHVIIGGSPRSGTTLLRRTFDRHPGMCCGPESNVLLPFKVAIGPLAAGYGIPADELRAMLAASPSQGAFVDAFAARYAEMRGRARWAEKTPMNIRHLDWIMARWPEARIIHVLRDGRDVVCSMREHPDRRWVDGAWVKVPNTKSIEEHAKRWVADTATGMRWRGDPRYLEVRYEDLVRTPEETLARVLGFLGEPYEAGLFAVDGAARPAAAAAEPPRPGRPDAAGAITTTSMGRWERDLLGDDREVVRRIAGARLVELGYASSLDW
ncbi:MAG: sulfotransferase [Chloroflexota bacterium]